MKLINRITAVAITSAVALSASGAPPSNAVKNIVLVHGAFADGSGWEGVATILANDGYTVSVVQPPQTSLADDVTATKRVLDTQNGPAVLVGHSYGGSIITEAGNHAKVVALVYVDAFMPDAGEPTMALIEKIPAASKAIRPTADGYLYLDPAAYPADFAADLPKAKAQFMAISQVMPNSAAFTAPIADPAWRKKPSWAVLATEDRSINPDLKRFMTKRANSKVTEVKGSHVTYISHPKEVTEVIEQAATAGTAQ